MQPTNVPNDSNELQNDNAQAADPPQVWIPQPEAQQQVGATTPSKKRKVLSLAALGGLLIIVAAGAFAAWSLMNGDIARPVVANSVLPKDVQKLPSFLNTTLAYPTPESNVKYVANDGSDAADGNSPERPYKTVCKAIGSVAAGGTVILRGGVYREGNKSTTGSCGSFMINKKVSIQSYKTERAWMKGSLVVSNWTQSESSWKVDWPYLASLASTTPEGNKDAISANNPMGADAAMVFVNGVGLAQVSSLSALSANSFYVDRSSNTIHMGADPSGKTVEATAFPRALYFNDLSVGSSVSGVGFAQYGTSWNQSTDPGAIITSAPSTVFDNIVMSQNAASGMWVIGNKQTVRNSVMSLNGHNGIGGNRAHGVVIENNVLDGNNTERLGTEGCSASCTAAGMKIAHTNGMTARKNTFSSNRGYGFWCDLTCENLTFTNNTSRDNTKAGIFFEVSSKAIIASNLIYNNATSGVRIAGSDNVRIYNNTLVNNGTGASGLEGSIGVYDDTRAPEPYGVERGLTWNTSNVEIVNNVMAYNKLSPFIDIRKSSQVTAESMVSKISSNAYYRTSASAPAVAIRRLGVTNGNYATLATAVAAGVESSTSIANDTGAPLFKSGGYAIDSASAVYQKAESIPSDIVSAIGNPSGPYDRGYLAVSELIVPGTEPAVPAPSPAPTPSPAPSPTPAPSPSTGTKDTVAPSVTITAPSANQTVKGSVTLAANATDNVGVTKVEFYVNGYLIGADTSAPYSVGWGSTLARNGTYPVTAIAYDAAGNKKTSAAVTITSNNVGGVSVKVTSPTDKSVIRPGDSILSATVEAAEPVKSVEFFVNNFSIGADGSAPYKIGWNSTTVRDGTYPVVAKVTMEDGRVIASSTVYVTLRR